MSSSRAFQKSGFHLRITLQFLEIVHVGSPLSRVIALRGFVGSPSASHARTTRELRLARTSQRAWRTSVTLTSIPAKASFYRPPLIKRSLIAMPAVLVEFATALL